MEMFKDVYHYSDIIMSTMTSEITGVSIVYSTISSGVDQRKHQSSSTLAFVRGIQRQSVNSPDKGPVTWKMFPCDDVITYYDNIASKFSMLSTTEDIVNCLSAYASLA